MTISRMEALADAIMEFSGYRDRTSTAYLVRNPGALKARMVRQAQTHGGLRVFASHKDGYEALLTDLRIKCGGRSSDGILNTAPLAELVRLMLGKEEATRSVLRFVRHSLSDDQLSDTTPISYFLEE